MLPRKIVRHHCSHTPLSANTGDTWNVRISVRKYQKFQRLHTRTEEFCECKLRIKTGYQPFEIPTIPVAHIRLNIPKPKPSCLFGNNNVVFSLLSYPPPPPHESTVPRIMAHHRCPHPPLRTVMCDTWVPRISVRMHQEHMRVVCPWSVKGLSVTRQLIKPGPFDLPVRWNKGQWCAFQPPEQWIIFFIRIWYIIISPQFMKVVSV
jgi:hypothetical protein